MLIWPRTSQLKRVWLGTILLILPEGVVTWIVSHVWGINVAVLKKKKFCTRLIHEHCSYSQSVRKFYLESGKIDILKKIEIIVHSWFILLKAGRNNCGHCDLNDIFPLHIYLVRETLFFKGKVREFWKVMPVKTMTVNDIIIYLNWLWAQEGRQIPVPE